MADKTRLFIAINVSKEVHDYLSSIQKEFSGLGNLNLTKSFHITLKFLGWVDNCKLKLIDSILNEVSFGSFDLFLDKFGVFPSPSYARVLWAGVSGNIKPLKEQVENKLKKDFGTEDRFQAHITLVRIRSISKKEEFKEKLNTLKIKPIKFRVASFSLFKSELTQQGHIYTSLKTYPLG